MEDQTALQTITTTKLRRRLKDLESLYNPKTGKIPLEVEREIHEIKRKLRSSQQPIPPGRRSLGNCINPKCRKRINRGQEVVKYGPHGLCCNFKCLIEAMTGS